MYKFDFIEFKKYKNERLENIKIRKLINEFLSKNIKRKER